MSSQFEKDIWMLQETLNGIFEAGADQVRRRDIRQWVDPSSDLTIQALREWEILGFVTIVADPRSIKEKDTCLRIQKRIEAVPMPTDLNDAKI